MVDSAPYDKNEAYNELLSFLSTLESGKPINPEDAMKELDEKIALVKQRGTWDGVDVDKYMDEVRGREPENPMNQEGLEEEINRLWESFADEMEGPHNLFDIYARLARHFANWQKEQMMKDAVEGEVVKDINNKLSVTAKNVNLDKFKFGEKVRVIVIPNTDEK